MSEQQAVRVEVVGRTSKEFGAGLASAKRLHGKYDPQTKTWLIPASMVEFLGHGPNPLYSGPQNPGLRRVGMVPAARPSLGCPHWTRDQGCPLHGEYCSGQ